TIAKAYGYAVADEEITDGVISVAVPVGRPSGNAIAALGFAAPKYRLSDPLYSDAVKRLMAAGVELSKRLYPAADDPGGTGEQVAVSGGSAPHLPADKED